MEEEQVAYEIRSAEEAAYRALALCSVIAVAFGAARTEIVEWLKHNDLWDRLAPSELEFLDSASPSKKQVVNASWLSERLIVVVWALCLLDELPPPDEQCDSDVFLAIFPPFAPLSVADFITPAQLRSKAELFEMADKMRSLHWEARDSGINGRSSNSRVNIGIIQERHHAINWLIGYDGLDWDEVTTDT